MPFGCKLLTPYPLLLTPMNSWQFYQYTQYPDNLNLHDEVQLRGLIKDYPYFQAAHLLLAKCLKNQDNYSFEKQLKLAALYAPNRSLLYSLLKSASKPVMIEDIAFPIAEPIEQEADPIEVIEEVLVVAAETAEEILEEKTESIIETEAEIIAETETPITAETIDIPAEPETVAPELPEGVIYITETITTETIEEQTIITDTVVEEIIEEDIIITDIITEELIIEEENIVADKITEELIVEDTTTGDIIVEETIIEELPTKIEEEAEIIDEPIAEGPIAQRAFTDWLRQTSSSGNSVFLRDLKDNSTLKQPETNYIIPSQSSENIAEQTMLSIAKQEPVQPPKPTFSDEILEKFITSNPTISRPKTEFFNPSKAAKKSLEPDENLATETLAKIALKQNNYLKAIKIYEKLSLRFPEKFTIFATQIKKIKTDNNLE